MNDCPYEQAVIHRTGATDMCSTSPPTEGFAWLKYDDNGHEFEANLAQVQLVAVLEG